MRTRTLVQLRDEAKSESDMVGSAFVSDAQWNVWINSSIARLWTKLVKADPQLHYLTSTINTTAGTAAYSLPSDFMQVLAVDHQHGANWLPLDRFMLHERSVTPGTYRGPATARYDVKGNGIAGAAARIHFDPDPGTGVYRIHYVQGPQLLAADGEAFDGVAGFERWVVLDCAAKALKKEESDASALLLERDQISVEIEQAARRRDAGRSHRIVDVTSYRHTLPVLPRV